jgi:hypothetical protein
MPLVLVLLMPILRPEESCLTSKEARYGRLWLYREKWEAHLKDAENWLYFVGSWYDKSKRSEMEGIGGASIGT